MQAQQWFRTQLGRLFLVTLLPLDKARQCLGWTACCSTQGFERRPMELICKAPHAKSTVACNVSLDVCGDDNMTLACGWGGFSHACCEMSSRAVQHGCCQTQRHLQARRAAGHVVPCDNPQTPLYMIMMPRGVCSLVGCQISVIRLTHLPLTLFQIMQIEERGNHQLSWR
eukprot:jgi/Ulvmu1/7061/UM033_0121.1